MELQNDYDYGSDTPGSERNNLTVKLEPEARVRILPVPGLSIYVHGVLEQIAGADPDEDRYFEDEGFYIQDLFARHEIGPFTFRGGKLNPGFGIAWDRAPGIYGTDIAEDYEIAERIALSASAKFGSDELGRHTVTAGTFFLDTSPLQHTVASRSRGTLGRPDGGVSNTGDFSSFNLMLEGGEFPAAKDTAYHLAYIHQAHGTDGTTDETGFAAAVTTKFSAGNNVALSPLAEVVWFRDVGGIVDKDSQYLTGSLLSEWKRWNLALSYTRRKTEEIGADDVTDYQYQVSVGYAFDFGLTADVGWKRLKESGAFTDTVGVLFTYQFGFEY